LGFGFRVLQKRSLELNFPRVNERVIKAEGFWPEIDGITLVTAAATFYLSFLFIWRRQQAGY